MRRITRDKLLKEDKIFFVCCCVPDGLLEGTSDGALDGNFDGASDGDLEGTSEGAIVGVILGAEDTEGA